MTTARLSTLKPLAHLSIAGVLTMTLFFGMLLGVGKSMAGFDSWLAQPADALARQQPSVPQAAPALVQTEPRKPSETRQRQPMRFA
ncbi:hypothetical protein ABWL39_13575 [Chitinivorax sp. PXF-14]|uniref:hypothetical protein n=1 Tax=Chitinivorax sp. PXF-14 TaxID=3230488 RepID=UPI0034673783